jgi:Pin2-interacting protein X1
LKLDKSGIGAARYEREARAAGRPDAWTGAGGELGGLFERLNAAAAAAAAASPAPEAVVIEAEAEGSRKRKRDETAEEKDARRAAKKLEKAQEKAARKAEKKGEKAAAVDQVIGAVVAADPELAKDAKAVRALKKDAAAGKPIRLA